MRMTTRLIECRDLMLCVFFICSYFGGDANPGEDLAGCNGVPADTQESLASNTAGRTVLVPHASDHGWKG